MTKAQIRKKCFSEIHSDHVQLHFCKHGIWDYDGKCRIWLVLFTVCQSYRIYRGIPVCSDRLLSEGRGQRFKRNCISERSCGSQEC